MLSEGKPKLQHKVSLVYKKDVGKGIRVTPPKYT